MRHEHQGLKPWSETVFGLAILFAFFAALMWAGNKLWPTRCPQTEVKVERSSTKAR